MEELNNNIIQTGPLTGNELQKLNNEKFENNPTIPPYVIVDDSLEAQLGLDPEELKDDKIYQQYVKHRDRDPWEGRTVSLDTQHLGARYNPEIDEYGFKGRVFDASEMRNLRNIRAEEQSRFAQFGNALVKGIVTAGTTFADGMVGLPFGIATAITEGKFSNIWNNEISQELRSINQSLEEALPNYETEAEQNQPWYHKLGKMNFWADGVMKNALGFQLGAMYSGQAFNAALRGLGVLKGPLAAKIAGTVYGALNEGRIEAGNMYDDMMKLDIQKIDDAYLRAADEIRNSGLSEREKSIQMQALNENYNKQIEAADERNSKAGNLNLALNTAILSVLDFYTIGNLYARGFDTARSMAGERMAKRGLKTTMKDIGEGVAKVEADEASTIIKNGFNYELKKQFQKPIRRGLWSGLKTGVGEGFEEMEQQFSSVYSGNVFSYDDPDAYYLSFINPEQVQNTKGFLESLTEGWNGSFGSGEQWEQFSVGFLSAALGRPTFGRVSNMAQDTWLGKGKTVGLSGGIIGNMRANTAAAREAGESVEVMNKYIQQLNDNARYFTQNNSFTEAMNEQAVEGDKFEWSNMKDNLDFAAVAHFAKMGKLQDLKDLVHNDLADVSDEELKSIGQNFTPVDSKYSGWKNTDGSNMWETEDGRKAMREQIKKREEQILKGIDDYEQAVRQVRGRSNNGLTEDQVEELAWYDWKSKQFKRRSDSLINENGELFDRLGDAISGILPQWERQKTELEEKVKAHPDNETHKDHLKNITNNIKDFGQLAEVLQEIQTKRGNARIMFDADFVKTMENLFDEEGVKELNKYLGTEFDMGEFDNLRVAFNDLYKMSAMRTQFMERYMDFMKNPEKLMSNREKLKKGVDTAREKAKNHIETRRVKKMSEEEYAEEIMKKVIEGDPIDEITRYGQMLEESGLEGFDELTQAIIDDSEKKIRQRDKLVSVIDQMNSEVEEDVYNMIDPIFVDIAEVNMGTDPLFHLEPEYWDKDTTRAYITQKNPELDEQQVTDKLQEYKEQARRIKERMDMAVEIGSKERSEQPEQKPRETVVPQGGKDPGGDVFVEPIEEDKEEESKSPEDKARETIEKKSGYGIASMPQDEQSETEDIDKIESEHAEANALLDETSRSGPRTVTGEYPYEVTIHEIAEKSGLRNLAKLKIRPVTENGVRPYWALYAANYYLLGDDVNDDNFDEKMTDFAAKYLDGNEDFPDTKREEFFKKVKTFYHTFKYLTEKGAFTRRNHFDEKGETGIHNGMKLRLAVDFDLNKKTNNFIVLVTDENGNVLGDVSSNLYKIIDDNILTNIKREAEKSKQSSGLWFSDYTSTIKSIGGSPMPFVKDKDGKPIWTKLNKVFQKKRIGIYGLINKEGQTLLGLNEKEQAFFDHNRGVMDVVNNTNGRAFVMIPWRYGEYAIVSFRMPPFDYEKHKNTQLVSFVRHYISKSINELQNRFKTKEELIANLGKANDILSDAGVALSGFVPYSIRLYVNPQTGYVEMEHKRIDVAYKEDPYESKKIDGNDSIEVIGKDANAITEAILKSWDGSAFQVNYDNALLGGVNANIWEGHDYNDVIGEIAEVNLPARYDGIHNLWFKLGDIVEEKGSGKTVKVGEKKETKKNTKEKEPKSRTEGKSPSKTEEQKKHDYKVQQYSLQTVRIEMEADDILQGEGFDGLDDYSWAALLQCYQDCKNVLVTAKSDGVEHTEFLSEESSNLFKKIGDEAANRGYRIDDLNIGDEYALEELEEKAQINPNIGTDDNLAEGRVVIVGIEKPVILNKDGEVIQEAIITIKRGTKKMEASTPPAVENPADETPFGTPMESAGEGTELADNPTEMPVADVRQVELPFIEEMREKLTKKRQNEKIYRPAIVIEEQIESGRLKLKDENIEKLYRLSLMLSEKKFAEVISKIDDSGTVYSIDKMFNLYGERTSWKPFEQQPEDVQKAVASDVIESKVVVTLGKLGIKGKPLNKEEAIEVFIQGMEHVKAIFGDELLVDEEAMQYLRDNGLVDEEGKITDTQLMSRGSIEMLQYALEEKGIVKSNLINASLSIVPSIGQPFNLNQKITSLKKEILEYAKKEGIVGTMTAEETNKGVAINISNDSIDKFVDDSSNNKSISKEIHLSVLPVIRDMIRESIEAEIHPDYIKVNGKRTIEKHNPDGLIHRCYGAIDIEGEIYRVKITLKENLTNKQNQKAYSYEVANVELLNDKTERPSNDSQTSERAVLTISGAKLLKDVEKSYDKGKKLLDESEKKGIELLSTQQDIIHGFQHNGRIGLFTNEIDPSAPVHEYTHAWDSMMQRINPEFWAKGVQLMMTEAKDLWDAVADDVNYGKSAAWQAKTEEERNNLIASEVHSRLVGGAYVAYASEKKSGIIQWLKDFFKELANAFGWNTDRIDRMTLDELVNATLADFANGMNPNDMSTNNEYHVVKPVYDEMVAIREKTKKNGTFMKAPNGKPTNLDERNWLLVRTRRFKDWFGDWEKHLRIEKLHNSQSVTIDKASYDGKFSDRTSAKEWMHDNIKGEYINSDTNDKINITNIGINEVTSHGTTDEAHMKSLVAIPQMLENAIFITEQPNTKGNEKYDSYRYYVVGLNIDGENYTAKIVVGVKGDNKYYDHRLTEIEKGSLIDDLNRLSNSVAENRTSFFVGKDTKLLEILRDNSSKVVDENGEPLVVYHGGEANITTFLNRDENPDYEKTLHQGYTSKDRVGIYFSKYKSVGESYARPYRKNGHIYSVFLNIKNPKEVKFITTIKDRLIRYGTLGILNKPTVDEIHRKELDTIYKNYDGVNHSNGTEYIVFNSNQIKSATDNNGLFDESNPNINLLVSQTQPQEEFSKEELQLRKPVIRLLAGAMQSLNREGQVSLANALLRTNDRYNEFAQLLNDMETLRANDANSMTYYDAFNNVARLLMGDTDWKATRSDDAEAMENLIDQYRHYLRFGILPQVPTATRLFRQMKHVMNKTKDNEFALRDAYRTVHKYGEPHVHIRTSAYASRIPVKFQLNKLDAQQKEYLDQRGINNDEYEMLSGQERERLLRCMA